MKLPLSVIRGRLRFIPANSEEAAKLRTMQAERGKKKRTASRRGRLLNNTAKTK